MNGCLLNVFEIRSREILEKHMRSEDQRDRVRNVEIRCKGKVNIKERVN